MYLTNLVNWRKFFLVLLKRVTFYIEKVVSGDHNF